MAEPMVLSCPCGNNTFFLGYSIGSVAGLPFVVVCTKCKRVHGQCSSDDPIAKMAKTFEQYMDPDRDEPWKGGGE